MDIEVITEYKDFIALEEDWNSLLERCANENVFLTHEWFRCWWEAFSSGKNLFIILVKDANNIIAIAPLMISKGKHRCFSVKKLTFIKDDNAAHADFIIPERKKESISLIIDYLQKHKKLWDISILESIINESKTFQSIQYVLKEKKSLFNIKEELHSPFLTIFSDWNSYISSKSRKFRKTLRNEENRVNRLGNITIEEHTNDNNINNILSEIYEISAKSWKGKIKSDISKSIENQNFFTKLSETAAKNGWLSIWLLRVDGKAIAMEYHLKYKNIEYGLRGDFDGKYSYFSPGGVLDQKIIQQAFESNLNEYDMCGGASEYKMKWGCSTRQHSILYIFNSKIYSHMIYIIEEKMVGSLRKIRLLQIIKKYIQKREES